MSKTLWLVLGVGTCVVLGTQLNRCLTCQPPQNINVNANLRLEGAAFLSKSPPSKGAQSGGPATSEATSGGASTAGEPIPGPKLPDVPNIAGGIGSANGTDGGVAVGLAPNEAKDNEAGEREAGNDEVLIKKLPTPEETADSKDAKKAKLKKLSLTFDKLASYDYKFPDIGAKEEDTKQIPGSVQKLEGRTISIRGFMIPMANDGENVLEFVLVRNQSFCCFGVYPKMNEWIHVKMAPGKTAPFALDVPITIHGELHVGEEWENGVVMSLYRLDCTTVDEPPVYR